jgi:hypothetical protein
MGGQRAFEHPGRQREAAPCLDSAETISVAASAFGIVLHNAGLSALAAALLIMSFARPVVDQS